MLYPTTKIQRGTGRRAGFRFAIGDASFIQSWTSFQIRIRSTSLISARKSLENLCRRYFNFTSLLSRNGFPIGWMARIFGKRCGDNTSYTRSILFGAEITLMKAWRFHAFKDMRLDEVIELVCGPEQVVVEPLE